MHNSHHSMTEHKILIGWGFFFLLYRLYLMVELMIYLRKGLGLGAMSRLTNFGGLLWVGSMSLAGTYAGVQLLAAGRDGLMTGKFGILLGPHGLGDRARGGVPYGPGCCECRVLNIRWSKETYIRVPLVTDHRGIGFIIQKTYTYMYTVAGTVKAQSKISLKPHSQTFRFIAAFTDAS
jgi:hypothetical protein